MDAQEALVAVRSEGVRLLDVARMDVTRPVPTYPGWTIADLLAHTGSVHRWVTQILRTGSHERIRRESQTDREAARLLDWFASGLEELVAALEETDPGLPLWTLTGAGGVGFWQQRMAHETAVHRWDAERAFGPPSPFAPGLAVSGIPETLEIHVIRPLQGHAAGGGQTLSLACTDTPGQWSVRCGQDGVRLEPGLAAADAEVSGNASDVWLFAMARPPAALERRGDPAAIETFERAIRTIPLPTR